LKVSLQPPSSFFLVVEQQLVETTTTCHALWSLDQMRLYINLLILFCYRDLNIFLDTLYWLVKILNGFLVDNLNVVELTLLLYNYFTLIWTSSWRKLKFIILQVNVNLASTINCTMQT
jgi:hypothetical protein